MDQSAGHDTRVITGVMSHRIKCSDLSNFGVVGVGVQLRVFSPYVGPL
jgi:hypothetical protein